MIIPTCNFLAQCGSLSQCVLCVHEIILNLLLYVMPLDCHRKASKLHGTFKSCNRYRNQTISKQVLTIARYSAPADDLDMFVFFFFYFHEIIEEPRKMQYLDTDIQLSDNLPCLSRNKMSMSACFRMAITILVPVIL